MLETLVRLALGCARGWWHPHFPVLRSQPQQSLAQWLWWEVQLAVTGAVAEVAQLEARASLLRFPPGRLLMAVVGQGHVCTPALTRHCPRPPPCLRCSSGT